MKSEIVESTEFVGSEGRDRGRLIAWVLLGAPLLIYAIVWPVRARLDRGVIEEHMSGSIWRQMVERLPEIGWQPAFEAAFVVGLIVFTLGSLLLVWLALDRSEGEVEPIFDPSLLSELPVSE